jgi:hypothetical protein
VKTAMKEKEAKGLLAIWADIEEDYRVEFEKWHNCEHVPERVSIPGFYVGHRYQGIGDAPEFLMFYETLDSKTLGSEPYLHSLNNPTPWTRETIRHFSNIVRTVYSLLGTAGKKPPLDAPYLFVHRFNAVAGSERDIIRWYKGEYLPTVCGLPGVYRGRLYESDLETSNINTEERKVHRAESGEQRFLAIYEILSLDLCAGENRQGVPMDTERSKSMLKKLIRVDRQFYWHDFTMYAPEAHSLQK